MTTQCYSLCPLTAQGWGWGREAGGVSNNQVVGNKIESVLSERCCDGGAVCKQPKMLCGRLSVGWSTWLTIVLVADTLGPQPNSSIRANHLVQPFRTDWPSQRQSCLYASEEEKGYGIKLPPNPAGNGNYSGCAGKGIYVRSRMPLLYTCCRLVLRLLVTIVDDLGFCQHDNGSGGFMDTENVIDGAWNRFITGNNPMYDHYYNHTDLTFDDLPSSRSANGQLSICTSSI